MSDVPDEVRARAALVDALRADLVGPFYPADHPGSTEEVLPLAPSRWYLTGFLAPERDRETRDPLADDEFAGLEDEPEETAAPEPQPKQRHRFPASMGLSLLLEPGGPDHVRVVVGSRRTCPSTSRARGGRSASGGGCRRRPSPSTSRSMRGS
ncbi:MAG: hypothetical protein M5U28_14070 [Sandaracinaceae bacterium]|nr:hypothetical protein [Sandaracinaceae bacterium]